MRISGITIPDNKQLQYGLTALYGVGRTRAAKVLDASGIAYDKKPGDLSTDDENKIRKALETFAVEGDLKREISGNIKRMRDIRSYRGSRHSMSLPAHGQRTKTNSRTRRGNIRKTMGSGRRKVDKK